MKKFVTPSQAKLRAQLSKVTVNEGWQRSQGEASIIEGSDDLNGPHQLSILNSNEHLDDSPAAGAAGSGKKVPHH